jgi:hypothetical protein
MEMVSSKVYWLNETMIEPYVYVGKAAKACTGLAME